jgi:hypothetical protein
MGWNERPKLAGALSFGEAETHRSITFCRADSSIFFGTADEKLNAAKEKGSAMPLPFESSDFQARSITDPDI